MEMYEFQEHLQDVIYFYLIIKLVWKEALSLICDEDKCTLHAVETIMVNWKEDKEVVDHVVLLVIMIWYVWLSRNNVIFRDEYQYSIWTFHRTKYLYELSKAKMKEKVKRIKKFNIDKSFPRGIFDGASRGNSGTYGVGGVLHLSYEHKITFAFGLGLSSKNWAEARVEYGHRQGDRYYEVTNIWCTKSMIG